MSAFLYEYIFAFQMIPIEEEYKNNLFFSSYFVLYFYLRESLGKEENFRRANKIS